MGESGEMRGERREGVERRGDEGERGGRGDEGENGGRNGEGREGG